MGAQSHNGPQNSTFENVADWNRKAAKRASFAAQQAEKSGDFLKAAKLREDQARYLANALECDTAAAEKLAGAVLRRAA